MNTGALGLVEQGLRFAHSRGAVLAADAANAGAQGSAAADIVPMVEETPDGARFAAAFRAVAPAGAVDHTMGATAENSIRFRALADQERAMLREFKTIAEEARR